MHYYQFNIGDYAKHTRHLTNNEDLAYRRILDYYYLNEEAPTSDIKKLARLINMRGCEDDILNVLEDFFSLDGEVWVNSRVDKELSDYAGKADRARENGKKGGRPPAKKKVGSVENKKPSKKEPLDFELWTSKPSDQVLKEWISHRTKKKATTSQLVINKMSKEINDSLAHGYSADDCLCEAIERGWQGFKSEWIKNSGAKKTALHDVADKVYYEGTL